MGVAVVDALLTLVALLVREWFFFGLVPWVDLWGWMVGVSSFPLIIDVWGVVFWMATDVVYHVRIGLGGFVLVEWFSPWLPMRTILQVGWLTAAVLPAVVAFDLVVATGAFALVAGVDWIRLRLKPQEPTNSL
jgi:hypothetical protein